MIDQKKRRRRTRGGGGGAGPTGAIATSAAASHEAVQRGLPVWRWRTFPVYFALTGGLFLGIYLGILARTIQANNGNDTPVTVVLIIGALSFGFGLSRVTSRFMVTHGIFRPKVKQ